MKRLLENEVAKEIHATGDDDPSNLKQRIADAQKEFIASGWPAEVARPRLKDLLAAAHERDKQRNIARDKKIEVTRPTKSGVHTAGVVAVSR